MDRLAEQSGRLVVLNRIAKISFLLPQTFLRESLRRLAIADPHCVPTHQALWTIQLAKIDGTSLRGLTRRGNDTSAYDLLGCIGVRKADLSSYNPAVKQSLPCALGFRSSCHHSDRFAHREDVVQTKQRRHSTSTSGPEVDRHRR